MSDLRDLARYLGVNDGIVTQVEDASGRHRIKARVPGIMSETPWALPRGAGLGPQRGASIAPRVGDAVLISFVGGDVQRPIWEPSSWGTPQAGSEMPTDMLAAGDQAHLVQGVEIGGVRFTVDERPETRQVRLTAREGDTEIGYLEIDMVKRIVTLHGLAALILQSTGRVHIDAMNVSVKERNLLTTSEPA